MRIRTATNYGLVFIIVIIYIPIFLLTDFDFSIQEDVMGFWIMIVVGSIITLYMLVASIKNYYLFEEKELFYVMGFKKVRIPYEAISEVRVSYNPVSSPAMTMRRIEIISSYWSKKLFSLPARKDQALFKKELKKHCPRATIDLSKIEK